MLILLTLGQQCLNLWIEQKTRQTADLITRTLLVGKEAERLLNTAGDKKRVTLKDYTQERSTFGNSFNHRYNLKLNQLEQIKYLHNRSASQLERIKLFDANRYTRVLAQSKNDGCRLTQRQKDKQIQTSYTPQSCFDEPLAQKVYPIPYVLRFGAYLSNRRYF